MKTTKLPSQITVSCGRDEDAGRLVLAAAEGEPAKLRRFSITAYTGGKMSLPNIPYPVVVDMSGLRVSAKSRPILRDHNPSQIVGHTDNVTVNGGVLKVDGSVSGANCACNRDRRQLRQRFSLAGEHRGERPEDGVRRGRRKSPSQRAVLRGSALRRASGDARRGVVRGARGRRPNECPDGGFGRR